MPTLQIVHLSEVQTEHYFTHCTPNFDESTVQDLLQSPICSTIHLLQML